MNGWILVIYISIYFTVFLQVKYLYMDEPSNQFIAQEVCSVAEKRAKLIFGR
jgi:hypothetical protein